MSDQHPVYAPPPGYAPAPPADAYGTDPYGAPTGQGQPFGQDQPAGSGKKKTVIIIAVIVAVLALCCCAGVGGAFLLFSADTTTTEGGDFVEEALEDEATDVRLQEWLEWDPVVAAEVLLPAPVEKESLILEGMSIVAPEFTYVESVWWQGGYDEADSWYYPDWFYVRASHPASDDISGVVELLIEGTEMAALDIDYDAKDGDLTTQIDGGSRVLEYEPKWGDAGFVLATEDDIALWQTLGDDWPDAVVIDRNESDSGEGYVDVDISVWPVFIYDTAIPYVSVTYEKTDEGWLLYEWEYVYPEDTDTTT